MILGLGVEGPQILDIFLIFIPDFLYKKGYFQGLNSSSKNFVLRFVFIFLEFAHDLSFVQGIGLFLEHKGVLLGFLVKGIRGPRGHIGKQGVFRVKFIDKHPLKI